MESEKIVKANVQKKVVVNSRGKKLRIYARFFKRPMDLFLALLAIVVFSPLILSVAVLVAIKLGRPVLFRQKRPGKNEKLFIIYKFRTMTDARGEDGKLMPDGERLTKYGKWLRSTSFDELPELFSIVKGDMSVVGPRPQLIKDMVFMTPEQRRRHDVRPGLSGLAQVNGRNYIIWEEKLKYDLEYINNITFLGDWRIIGKTIQYVLRKGDITQEGFETAEDFGDYLLRNRKIDKNEYTFKINESQTL